MKVHPGFVRADLVEIFRNAGFTSIPVEDVASLAKASSKTGGVKESPVNPESAMVPETPKTASSVAGAPRGTPEEPENLEPPPDEWDGYWIIKAIVTEVTDPSRVAIRDSKSYCVILLDDNNRKPTCRFFFHSKQKFITVFDSEKPEGEKILINNLNYLFKLQDRFKKTVAK